MVMNNKSTRETRIAIPSSADKFVCAPVACCGAALGAVMELLGFTFVGLVAVFVGLEYGGLVVDCTG